MKNITYSVSQSNFECIFNKATLPAVTSISCGYCEEGQYSANNICEYCKEGL